jgi:hypothetical protein
LGKQSFLKHRGRNNSKWDRKNGIIGSLSQGFCLKKEKFLTAKQKKGNGKQKKMRYVTFQTKSKELKRHAPSISINEKVD